MLGLYVCHVSNLSHLQIQDNLLQSSLFHVLEVEDNKVSGGRDEGGESRR